MYKQRNWQWIFPLNVTFFVSVTLTGLVRISKTRYRRKDLSLKKLLFINKYLHPASGDPLIFLDKSGRLKERCMKRQNENNTRALNESSFERRKPSLEFEKPAFLYSPLQRISRNDLFLEKHNNDHSHVKRKHRPTALAC